MNMDMKMMSDKRKEKKIEYKVNYEHQNILTSSKGCVEVTIDDRSFKPEHIPNMKMMSGDRDSRQVGRLA
jgi:hypothetical protein